MPYERIPYIDWEPDPADGAPRLYVAYNLLSHEAFRDVVVYEGGFDGGPAFEMYGVRYIGHGGGLIKRARRAARHARYQLGVRREQKQVRGGRHY
jgi:hypothetical protein